MSKNIPGHFFIKSLEHGHFSDVDLYRSLACRNQLVVIKTIYLDAPANSSKYSDSLREIEIVSNLNHPRIIKFLSFFYDYNSVQKLYIVMSYTKNGSLRNQMNTLKQRSEYYAEKVLLQNVYDLLDGVRYLHSENILHCDLKPENILVWKDFRLKICDFGISTKMDAVTGIGQPLAWGTPLYLAPEVLENFTQTKLSDVYAIGVMFYEMMTLTHPFEPVKSTNELYSKAYNQCYNPIDINICGYFYGVRDVIYSMLSTNIFMRPSIDAVIGHPIFDQFRADHHHHHSSDFN